MAEDQAESTSNSIELATELTIAWLSNPNVRVTAEEVPAFLRTMHATIGELSKAPDADAASPVPEHVPAVSIRSSVKPDYIVSLIDGRKMKSLKRHLAAHGLTPKEYRERYGLKPDYPMVAPSYSAHRREVAQKLGLGRKVRTAVPTPEVPPAIADAPVVADMAAAAAKLAAKTPRRAAKPKTVVAPKPVKRTRAKKDATAS